VAASPFAPSRTPIDVFREFESESLPHRRNQKAEKLSDLFRPPLEMIFPGSFEDAKVFAKQQTKLLLVSLLVRQFDLSSLILCMFVVTHLISILRR
jgi:hypothetical protein